MKTKLFRNFLLVFAVIGILLITMLGLFVTTENRILAVDLNNQNNLTNNSNVTFDAYFEDSSGGQTHSIITDVNPEYPYLYLNIGVTNGTLINPTVQFLDLSDNPDINYTLPYSNVQNVQSIDEMNQKIVFNNIENLNSSHLISKRGLQISTQIGESFEISDLNKDSKVLFTAVYQDSNGNTSNISKEIYLNVGWTGNFSMDLAQRVTQYFANNDGSGSSVTLETTVNAKINSAGKHNLLPVKQTTLVIDVPTYEGIAPTDVQVKANKTIATNGNDETNVIFDTSNWSYDSSSNKITINVANPENDGFVTSKRGSDEYVITYTYPKEAYDLIDLSGVDILNKVSGTMTLYSNGETINISNSIDDTITLTNYFGNKTGSISKTSLFVNTMEEYAKDISYGYLYNVFMEEVGDLYSSRIEFNQVSFNSDTSSYPSYISGVNYVPITEVLISVDSFANYLGSSGSVKIYATDNTLIDTITTSTSTRVINSVAYYSVPISEDIGKSNEKLVLETSTPLGSYLTLSILLQRNVSSDLPYTIPELQSFKNLSELVKVYNSTNSDPTNFVYDDKPLTISYNFSETSTNATLSAENTTLKPVSNSQTLTTNIILDNSKFTTDLWSNPTFDIELPEYITDISNPINIVIKNNPDLKLIEDSCQAKRIDNKIHICFKLDGTQKAIYNEKTIIQLNLIVNVDRFATTSTKDITLRYVNELVTDYDNPDSWIFDSTVTECGISNSQIDFVADPTVLCVSELTNFNDSNDVISSLDNNTAQISSEAVEPTMSLIIQNNHTVPVSDLYILGRIPYTGNKYVLSGSDLGTNIDTILTSSLTQLSNIPPENVTIYYSDNLNATKDLSLPENKWTDSPTDLSSVKSFMIVISNYEIAVGEQVKFEYTFSVPKDVAYNSSLFANFGTYYTFNSTQASSESNKIGLYTEKTPILRLVKESSIKDGDTVKEGDIITYTITVYNDGKAPAHNVGIEDTIPENTTYVELDGDNYNKVPDSDGVGAIILILQPNESYSVSFSVIVDEITQDGTIISNTATASADDIPDISSNTVEITANTTPVLAPDLRVVKESSIEDGATVKEGDIITYTITVYNDGNGPANNVIIKDIVPENTTYVKLDGDNYIKDPNTETITSSVRETLEPGESFSISFSVMVDEITRDGTTISNTATVSADGIPDTSSNTVGITANTTPVLAPDLRVVKESSIKDGDIVKEGDIITYTITVYNDGDGSANNVIIKDIVPENTTYVELDGEEYVKNPDIETISSSVRETLEPGDNFSVSFSVMVDEITQDGTTISNTATASADGLPDTSSNTVGITANTTPVLEPDLRVVKESSIQDGDIVKEGDIITYTITVYNDGDAPAHNVVIKDTVPENTTYVELDGDEYVRDPNIETITSNVRETLEPGDNFSVSFSVMVDEITQDGITISNTATVSADGLPDTSSNTVGITANTTPVLEPDLRVVKESSIQDGDIVKEGDIITYTITVYNDGDAPAHNVVIKDTVPENTTYVELDGDEYVRDPNIETITSSVKETLEPGENFSISFSVMVDEITQDGTTISNTATVSADGLPDTSSNTVGITANTTPDPEPEPEPEPPDDTTSDDEIPNTGNYTILTIAIVFALGLLVFSIIKYVRLKIE